MLWGYQGVQKLLFFYITCILYNKFTYFCKITKSHHKKIPNKYLIRDVECQINKYLS